MDLFKLWSIELMIPSKNLILCCPLLLLLLIFPSVRVFSNELALRIRWPKDWNFSISPSNEYSGLISFRIHQFDLLVIQGILKSLLQCHSLKASILWHSAFFTVQLSHPYMNTYYGGSNGKEYACNAGELGSIPRLGRSPGEGNSNLLQYSCPGNPMDRGL